MQETQVQSLGWEDPLEEGRTTHSSILAWRISMERGTQRATVHGVAKSRTQLSTFSQSDTQDAFTEVWMRVVKDILTPVVTQIPDFPLVCSWHYTSPAFPLKIRKYSFFLCSHILLLPTLVCWRIFPLQVSDPLLFLSSWTFFFLINLFFLILFYFKTLHNCISFAKYQNESWEPLGLQGDPTSPS